MEVIMVSFKSQLSWQTASSQPSFHSLASANLISTIGASAAVCTPENSHLESTDTITAFGSRICTSLGFLLGRMGECKALPHVRITMGANSTNRSTKVSMAHIKTSSQPTGSR
jgi:hypothetical protein